MKKKWVKAIAILLAMILTYRIGGTIWPMNEISLEHESVCDDYYEHTVRGIWEED